MSEPDKDETAGGKINREGCDPEVESREPCLKPSRPLLGMVGGTGAS